jgi:hypothetical protein
MRHRRSVSASSSAVPAFTCGSAMGYDVISTADGSTDHKE